MSARLKKAGSRAGQLPVHDPPTAFDPLAAFDRLTREWFRARFGAVTEPQRLGWPPIQAGEDVLISAPTGSGKTLAAFLTAIDSLVSRARASTLPSETQILYVSPLKALSNDVHKNLKIPLAGIAELARAQGVGLAPIRTAVRTGDTPAKERQSIIKHPPHILVTTPESLYIMLTAEGPRKMLKTVRTVIVDEIHAVADDKRGSHLALSLARLDRLVGKPIQKIGLSATVSPIEEVAHFLSPSAKVVQVGHRRAMDLAVEVPRDELGAVASTEMWGEIYDRLAELVRSHSTTLIFVNTRKMAERVAHRLGERLSKSDDGSVSKSDAPPVAGRSLVLPHHGSLSRALRFEAEQRLKSGELKAVVATASLELGIDIGSVDLVCQIGSPRSIGVALQRAGRAGHWVGALPKARFFATTRDELIECGALLRAIRIGELDRLEIPSAPLDILAQQIVAISACEEMSEDDLFALVRSAAPFRNLARQQFDCIVEMLSEGYVTSRGRHSAYLHRDQVHHMLRGRRGARLAAITSGGAIPETAQYQVIAEPEGTVIGSLDEDFAIESNVGDVFLLGTTSWRVRRVEAGRVRVTDAHGASPSVPFWLGEAPGRTRELSLEVSRLREDIATAMGGGTPVPQPVPRLAGRLSQNTTAEAGASARDWGPAPLTDAAAPPDPIARLIEECGFDRRAAEQAVAYVLAGRASLGVIPTQDRVVAERFFDEAGGMQLVIHSPFGARINKAWGLALRKRFCRTFNFELQAAATDNGLILSLTDQHSFPLEMVFSFLKTASVTHVLTQAMLDSPMFGARWKWNASRSLAVPRFSGGRKVPPPLQRMRTDDLLASVFPDQAACAENLTGEIRIPDHPLVNETIDNCLHEAMDLDGLIEILERIEEGTLETVAVDTREPSPFCHEILNANPYAFLDDAPLEERRTRAVQLRRTMSPEDANNLGQLDAAAIAQVAEESWPMVRDEHELHDALLTLIILPPVPEWQAYFEVLAANGRASLLRMSDVSVGPTAAVTPTPMSTVAPTSTSESSAVAPTSTSESSHAHWVATERLAIADALPEAAAVLCVLRGWIDSIGPFTTHELAARLSLPLDSVEAAIAQLESEGTILRGHFSDAAPGTEQYCHRRILARIHRMTLGRLRREVEPVTAAVFMRFLTRWQHTAPGTQLHGVDGLFQVLRQLQGYEISAAAWEQTILPSRVVNYEPELLDRLCLAGEVMWGRLSPHPALETPTGRRVRPTRVAPLAIFLREDAHRLLPPAPNALPMLSHPARDVFTALESKGASFFNELTRTSGRLASEVEDGLWELVAAGLVTGDGFENLRALIDSKRRSGQARARSSRPRHAAGRWALLDRPAVDASKDEAAAPDLEMLAQQLLLRWGVVFRDMLARETLAPPWRDLLQVYRRMEARGEVRGGRFVAGFVGEQFARPEALDLLRQLRRTEKTGEETQVAASDPLNLLGIVLPGPRMGHNAVRLIDGVPQEAA